MNCRQFENVLHEFVDGTLSARKQAAADKHLALCDACRHALHQEQQIAQRLSNLLHANVEPLVLPAQFQGRVAMALESRRVPLAGGELLLALSTRLALPLAIAACVCITAFLAIVFFGSQNPKTETARSASRDVESAISVHVSYRVRAYTFRREGNLVVDCLVFETNVVDTTFWAGRSRKPGEQERKMPL